MDDSCNNTDARDQAEEELLSAALSDEALEGASGTEKGGRYSCGVAGSHCTGPTQVC